MSVIKQTFPGTRVAFFLPSLAGGGAEKVMLKLARGFFEVTVAMSGPWGFNRL